MVDHSCLSVFALSGIKHMITFKYLEFIVTHNKGYNEQNVENKHGNAACLREQHKKT